MSSLNHINAAILMCLLTACSNIFHSDHASDQATPWSNLDFNNAPENFQFAIVGDRTGGARTGVFARAMDQVNWLQPEFVVSVGDLIEGYTEDTEQLQREWDELDNMVNSLDMPFFYVVGNHDMGNNTMRDYWSSRYGERGYYHFVYRDVLFLALNTEDPPAPPSAEMQATMARLKKLFMKDPSQAEALIKQSMEDGTFDNYEVPIGISDKQIAYVRKALAEHPDVRWTFVVLHKPAWVFTHPAWTELEAMLADRPYTVIAGHQHYYQHEQRDGRDYIQMGTTGGSFHRSGPGKMDHILWVSMTDDGPVFANIKLRGLQNKLGENGHPAAY